MSWNHSFSTVNGTDSLLSHLALWALKVAVYNRWWSFSTAKTVWLDGGWMDRNVVQIKPMFDFASQRSRWFNLYPWNKDRYIEHLLNVNELDPSSSDKAWCGFHEGRGPMPLIPWSLGPWNCWWRTILRPLQPQEPVFLSPTSPGFVVFTITSEPSTPLPLKRRLYSFSW